MIPTLFKIGPFPVHSYGLMLSIAFVFAWWVLRGGVRRRGWPDEIAYDVIAIAAIFGVIGAKLFHVIDHWDTAQKDLWGTVFSGTGLTFLGGPIVATPAALLYVKWKKYSGLQTMDAAAPALATGASIGRIGCLLAGDGCYGIPTDLPWGMTFPHGIVKSYVPVHPTPIYETLYHGAVAFALVAYDKRTGGASRPGTLFAAWMVAYGVGRFLIEFIRTNPRYLWGWSQSQFISAAAVIVGLIWLLALRRASGPGQATPAAAAG